MVAMLLFNAKARIIIQCAEWRKGHLLSLCTIHSILPGTQPTKILDIASSSPGVARICDTFAIATVREEQWQDTTGPLEALMREPLWQYATLHPLKRFTFLAILCYLVTFLPLFPTCFTCLARRRPWNVRDLMYSTCKKKMVEVSETAFWCPCLHCSI